MTTHPPARTFIQQYNTYHPLSRAEHDLRHLREGTSTDPVSEASSSPHHGGWIADSEGSATANANPAAVSPTPSTGCKRHMTGIILAYVHPPLLLSLSSFPPLFPPLPSHLLLFPTIPLPTNYQQIPLSHTHTQQSFYAQIRAIKAETGCYFNDTFMVETERAVGYAKVWVNTFQRRRAPCAGLLV